MGRPPKVDKQRQVAVALPSDIRVQIEEAAGAAGHSVAEEIRRRIKLALDVEAHDKPTRDLAAQLMWLAEEIARQSRESWHTNRKANEALAAALQEYLELLTPPISGGASDFFGPDDPATLGRTIARSHFHSRTEIEGSIEQVARKRRPPLGAILSKRRNAKKGDTND